MVTLKTEHDIAQFYKAQIGPNIFTEFSPDEMFFCVFTVVAGLAWFLSITDRHEYVKVKCFITDYSHIKHKYFGRLIAR